MPYSIFKRHDPGSARGCLGKDRFSLRSEAVLQRAEAGAIFEPGKTSHFPIARVRYHHSNLRNPKMLEMVKLFFRTGQELLIAIQHRTLPVRKNRTKRLSIQKHDVRFGKDQHAEPDYNYGGFRAAPLWT